jgi:ABC-2 type transport system ATP-binding protein
MSEKRSRRTDIEYGKHIAMVETPDPRFPALRLIGLSKSFGGVPAVDAIDLTVPAGSFFGLVGPNGAGKTTALSMAVGLLCPDDGKSEVFGHDVWRDPVRTKRMIGVLPDSLGLPERLTGSELLSHLGALRRMDRETTAARAEELLRVLELADAGRTLVINYSTGMRKKIGLAAALLHAPRLLVLDEPFEAVDPISAATIRTILQRFVTGGGSVVFSSHVMALVEQLCDRVAVMARGRVVATGGLEELRDGRSLESRFIEIVGLQAGGRDGLGWLAS